MSKRDGTPIKPKYPATDGVKQCIGCNHIKPTSEFGNASWQEDGFSTRCKACLNERAAKHRNRYLKEIPITPEVDNVAAAIAHNEQVRQRKDAKNERERINRQSVVGPSKRVMDRMRDPAKHRQSCNRSMLVHKFGIRPEDYDWFLNAQDGRCAICGQEENGKLLAVDHDHESNTVRGLLCSKCNFGLGHFKDNPELIFNAINYLASHAT